ncbi:histidine phosphatase family protein [Rhizobium sullae]|uniref:Histidine phosphatase family protein n=1 Tax=Rhizobium sullae TaxID=50338 RepID=A0A2N0D663_RHISU|nr:histidine phosphatase family protein [Rhizobium sullae]PKA41591.1 histidine phosphatase family protein [Rhizobium sullae]UWU13229.1 histidine phosphatase family protein [Rhizobium sullae]
MHTRLTWICHDLTSAGRSGRFPLDEPLEENAVAKTRAIAGQLQRADRVLTSPALRTRQTAEALSLSSLPDSLLADCDYGRWRGVAIADLQTQEPDNLLAWMSDPESAPHGGESIRKLAERPAEWMEMQATLGGHVVAVSHAALIRTAILNVLRAPLSSFWLVDIEPLSVIRMTHNGSRWALRFGG